MDSGQGVKGERIVLWLFLIQLVSMGAMEMSGPFWPLHLRNLGVTGWQLGAAGVGAYVAPMAGILFTSALWGRVGDRYGHRLMMLRALAGLSLTQFALAWAADAAIILVLRFVQGACAGFIAPAQAYGARVVESERRGRLFAWLQVSTNLGSLSGAVLGGWIFDQAGFRLINLLASLLCGLCMLAVLIVIPHQSPARADVIEAGRPGRQGKQGFTVLVSGLLLVTGVLLASRTLTQMPFSLYVNAFHDARNWLVGLAYGLLAFGFVVAAPLWARFFEGKAAGRSLLVVAVVAAGCATVALLLMYMRDIRGFVALHFVWGAMLGATTPVMTTIISRSVPEQAQGHVLGLVQGVSQFSAMVGIALGGILTHVFGLSSLYFWVGLGYGLAVLAILFTRKAMT